MDSHDLVSYLKNCLNSTFHPFITSYSFASREAYFTLADFQSKLLNYELIISHQKPTSKLDSSCFALYSQKSKSYPSKNRKPNWSFKNHYQHGFKLTTIPNNSYNSTQKLTGLPFVTNKTYCQINDKNGHQTLNCFHRMDFTYQGCHLPS